MAPRSSALQYNENQVELLVGPGLEAGARAIISVSPAGQRAHRSITRSPPWRPVSRAASRCCGRPGSRDADGERTGRARLIADHRVRRRRQSHAGVSQRDARGVWPSRRQDRADAARHRCGAAGAGHEQGDAAGRGQVAAGCGDHRRRPEVEPQHLRGDDAAIDGARRRAEVRRRRPHRARRARSTTGASSASTSSRETGPDCRATTTSPPMR